MAATQDQTPAAPTTTPIRVEFTGGLETLFANKKQHRINLPTPTSGSAPTVGDLVAFLVQTHLATSPRRDLFVLDGRVRPGILVLVNDADWELDGEAACELARDDEVVFVSTLHGG